MLNKVKGEWDYEKLASILAELEPEDLTGTGFSDDEMNAIVQSVADEAESLIEEEESGVVAEVRNRTTEEVQQQLESTRKIQFGMFSRHINSQQYSEWVDKLESLSEAGNSPAALGLVVSQMLGIQTLSEQNSELEESEVTENES